MGAAAAHWSRLARSNDAARLLAFAAGYSEAAPGATLGATLGVAGLSVLDATRLRGLHAETQSRFDVLVEIERFARRCAAVALREARDTERAGVVVLTDEGTGGVELARVRGDSAVVLAVAPAAAAENDMPTTFNPMQPAVTNAATATLGGLQLIIRDGTRAQSFDAAWARAPGAELAVADDANLVSLAPPPVWTAETEPRKFAGEIATTLRGVASRDGKLSASNLSAPGASAKVLRAFYFSADDARRDDEAVAAASADVADYDEDDAAMWVQIALTISLTVMFVFSLPWMVLGFLVSVCTLVCMAPRLLRNAKRRREPLGPPEPDNECLWVNYMWMALRLLWKAGGPGCIYFWLCIILLSVPFSIWFFVCHDDSSLC